MNRINPAITPRALIRTFRSGSLCTILILDRDGIRTGTGTVFLFLRVLGRCYDIPNLQNLQAFSLFRFLLFHPPFTPSYELVISRRQVQPPVSVARRTDVTGHGNQTSPVR
jgi:hypothetical protein